MGETNIKIKRRKIFSEDLADKFLGSSQFYNKNTWKQINFKNIKMKPDKNVQCSCSNTKIKEKLV